jgi:hypothetical protein
MQNQRRVPYARILSALLLALATCWFSGCGHGLRYRPDTDRSYIYHVEIKKGMAAQKGVNFLSGFTNTMFYTISPINRTVEGTDLKAAVTPEHSTDFAIKLDLGADRFTLTPDGEILDRIGPLGVIDWTMLFFRIPNARPRYGKPWTTKVKGTFLGADADIESKYKLEGRERRQGFRCARIGMTSTTKRMWERVLPNGVKMSLNAGQQTDGTIWFSPALGMPVEAKYTQKNSKKIVNEFTGEVLGDVTEVTATTLRLEPRKQ